MSRKLAIFDPTDLMPSNWVDNFFGNAWSSFNDMDMELYEEGNKVVAKLKAPGFNKDNLDITIENNVLTVTGKVHEEEKKEEKDQRYYYRKMEHKSFSQTFRLPCRVKAEESEASFQDGVVTIEMPKAEEALPKKVKVKTA